MASRNIYKLLYLLLIPILFSCDNSTEPQQIEDTLPSQNYTLVWSDEFNQESTQLDATKWNIEEGYGQDGWGNDEWQLYTNSQDNVKVENGNLVITTRFDSENYSAPGKRDGSITSGRVNTKNKYSFKYGMIQAKIKPPRTMGMWPAFWMLGANYDTIGWPQCGEIDVMEMSSFYHNENTTMCTVHWEEDGERVYYSQTKEFEYSLAEDYHIFEVEWDADKIVGRIDGVTYFTKIIDPETMSEFMNDFFIILNNAVGGNLGGAPDSTTEWPQEMLIDWVRVYQIEDTSGDVETLGIFTETSPVDANIVVGADAEIYVWENTLSPGSIDPYEGDAGMTWLTTGIGWFGCGIKMNEALNLSNFQAGYLNFMIKIPAEVTFQIGMNDINGNENYLEFPANQTAYGLVRDGEWGKASIPLQELAVGVDLSNSDYVFIIREENGVQCHFAIDDIYYSGGGLNSSSIMLDSATYTEDSTNAVITVMDEGLIDSSVNVTVDNSQQSFEISLDLDNSGTGSKTIEFVSSDANSEQVVFVPGQYLTVTYTDSNGLLKSASAMMEENQEPSNNIAIYSETYTDATLSYSQIINSADWSGNIGEPDVESTEVTPYDGTYSLSVDFQDLGVGWGGIAFDFSNNNQDVSEFLTFSFAVNSTQMNNLVHLGMKFEDNAGNQTELDISNYSPLLQGDWSIYKIPINNFVGVDFSDLKYLGIWSPKDASNNLLFGKLFFDNIYLSMDEIEIPDGEEGGIYTETHNGSVIAYSQVINSADWSGNVVEVNLENTEITALEGNHCLSIDFQDSGNGWGGIAFNFGTPGQDITSYTRLNFAINKTELSALVHLGIKLEDNSGGQLEVDIANYTPSMQGDWYIYEVPLSDFTGVDLTDFRYLGIWNPNDISNNLLFGKLYLDDIYLSN